MFQPAIIARNHPAIASKTNRMNKLLMQGDMMKNISTQQSLRVKGTWTPQLSQSPKTKGNAMSARSPPLLYAMTHRQAVASQSAASTTSPSTSTAATRTSDPMLLQKLQLPRSLPNVWSARASFSFKLRPARR